MQLTGLDWRTEGIDRIRNGRVLAWVMGWVTYNVLKMEKNDREEDIKVSVTLVLSSAQIMEIKEGCKTEDLIWTCPVFSH